MKVKLIIAALAVFFCVDAFAQDNVKTWRWSAEAESWSGDFFDFGVGANFGYQLSQRFYAGLGTSLFLDRHQNAAIPFYAVAKIDVLKAQNTPVVDFRGGLAAGRYLGPDGFGSIAFGYKVKGEKAVVCPMIGWAKVGGASSVSLRFAVEF